MFLKMFYRISLLYYENLVTMDIMRSLEFLLKDFS